VLGADGHGERLDKQLVRLATEFSRSHLQGLIERGHVWLDGRTCTKAATRLRVGQTIAVELVPTDESRAFVAQPMVLDILHEDADLLVINKPVGLVVHPAPGNWSGTLLNGLLAHHAAAATLPRAGIVHRLDKDTSGVMVVAKSLPAMTGLVRDIAARRVRRQYLAIAQGQVGEPALSIETPIGRDPVSRVKMAVVAVAAGGRPARTDVERVGGDARLSALQCRLHSGRTHQIRVHLAHSGHPLVGDALYGGKPALGLRRQALHALRLGFEHPVTRAALSFEAPAPRDFADAWAQLCGSAAAWHERPGIEI
jgi:23S rRNA pseudouridine1911/1915/1917 synthase